MLASDVTHAKLCTSEPIQCAFKKVWYKCLLCSRMRCESILKSALDYVLEYIQESVLESALDYVLEYIQESVLESVRESLLKWTLSSTIIQSVVLLYIFFCISWYYNVYLVEIKFLSP